MSLKHNCVSLNICRHTSGLTVLTLPGDLRAWNYGTRQQDYNQVMKQLGESRQPRLLFDLSNCSMLDSATVGILIALTKEAIRRDGSACLGGASEQIRETLSKLMLLEPRHRQLRWDVYDSVDSALAFSDALADNAREAVKLQFAEAVRE